MWGRGYWGAAYWAEAYWPTGTAGAVVVPPTPPAVGTGGPRPRRKFVLDRQRDPERRQERKPRQRRVPAVHVALSLTAPSAVVVAEVTIQPLLPVAVTIRLPWLAAPSFNVRGVVTSRLGLAEERIGELEAVLAAVMEDE